MDCCGANGNARGDGDQIRPKVTRNTGCTDVIWLVLYVAFWLLLVFIASFSLVYGNPLRLINGYDSFGNTCGTSKNDGIGNLSGLDMSKKPYLFYFNISNIKESLKICVEKCPDQNLETSKDLQDFYTRTKSMLCRYDFKFEDLKTPIMSAMAEDNMINQNMGPCPTLPVYASDPIIHRCVPRPVKDLLTQIISNLYGVLNSWDALEQALSDLYGTWKEILALSCLAFVISLVMVSLLHLLASFVAWIILAFVSIAAVGGTAYLWYTYVKIHRNLNAIPESQLLEESVRNETAFLTYSIIATIITVVLLLLVCTMSKRIEFLVDLFEEAAKCLGKLPLLFVQPFLTFVALIIFFTFWLTVIVCLATSSYPGVKPFHPYADFTDGAISPGKIGGDAALTTTLRPNVSLSRFKTFTLVEFVDPAWVRYFWWVYLIALVWVSEFILACQQMVIAGAVCQWYFNKRSLTNISPISTAMSRLACQHLGTVAKGSLLITIFKVPRLILTYLHAKMTASKETSECARCGLKCCICCFYCFEKFIRFMNHNAYTVVAMEGVNFCAGAQIAFSTLGANALRLVTVNSVGDFVLFLGKCFVTAATGCVGLVFFQNDESLHFYAIPLLAVCVFAFFIAHCVLSLYEVVIDTLFLCVCEDERLHPEGGDWQNSTIGRRDRAAEVPLTRLPVA